MAALLAIAPCEYGKAEQNNLLVLSLPNSQGVLEDFIIQEMSYYERDLIENPYGTKDKSVTRCSWIFYSSYISHCGYVNEKPYQRERSCIGSSLVSSQLA